jgi:nitrogen-specific signal transduction histidine kinase
MSTSPEVSSETLEQVKKEIRQIAHDISNPVGILRMAVYYLSTAKPEEDKRVEYYTMMNQNLDKLESHIRRLREASTSPSGNTPRQVIG